MSQGLNPYAAPETEFKAQVVEATEDERLRNKYLKHEASVQSIGTLHLIAAVVFGVLILFLGVPALMAPGDRGFALLTVTAYVALFAVSCSLVYGLWTLRPWARVLCAVIAVISILGTVASMRRGGAETGGGGGGGGLALLINGYILYLLASANGTMVFSERYRQVILATPHIKYGTSPLVKSVGWILLGIILLIVLAGVFAALSERR